MAVLRDTQQRLIDEYFQQNPYWAFNHDELSEFIAQNRPAWGLPKSWSKQHVSDILLEGGWLQRVSLTSDLYRPKTRFASRLASRFQIGLSIRKGSYLSHGTAASLHSLTDTDLSITYINKEQSPKTSNRTLSQDAIDRAFQRSPRESNYRFWQMDPAPPTQYVLLNGKASRDFGVESVEHPEMGRLRVSNLERTLVELAVRPQYSGGASAVLKAYVKARERVDVSRLASTLEQLDYAYPYHQSIGFLMSRARFDRSDVEKFKTPGLRYDFYLAHRMPNASHDPDWKLYYPRDIDT